MGRSVPGGKKHNHSSQGPGEIEKTVADIQLRKAINPEKSEKRGRVTLVNHGQKLVTENVKRALGLEYRDRRMCTRPEDFAACLERFHASILRNFNRSKIHYIIGSDSMRMTLAFKSLRLPDHFLEQVPGVPVHTGRNAGKVSDPQWVALTRRGDMKAVTEFFLLSVTDVLLTNCRFPRTASAVEGNTFAYNVIQLRGDPVTFIEPEQSCNIKFHISRPLRQSLHWKAICKRDALMRQKTFQYLFGQNIPPSSFAD